MNVRNPYTTYENFNDSIIEVKKRDEMSEGSHRGSSLKSQSNHFHPNM